MIIENVSDKRLKQVEKELLQSSLLKLEGLDKNRVVKKKPEIGIRFIINQMHHKPTLYACNGQFQCYSGKRRSQGDIFKIMKYYYPNITLKEVRQLLFENISDFGLNTDYCGTIHKRVFWKDTRPYVWWGNIYACDRVDEWGFKLKTM